MKKLTMRTPGGKSTTWTQTTPDLYVGRLECDGCHANAPETTLKSAKDHADKCRVISVEDL
ncbi:hypothetical protein [Sphaerisporangium rhizosphaerae]|uniref:DUF1059 domain-containing protein n=1 Tax=Sphaerisporangium rhizosphaerae TaxID=2269375 RepID=A0ABW2P3E5_9ACTN